LLCLWFDRCESLTDSSLPVIFYPFGTDEGDSVVTTGYRTCRGPIRTPYTIFGHRTLYVSFACVYVRPIVWFCCVLTNCHTGTIYKLVFFLLFLRATACYSAYIQRQLRPSVRLDTGTRVSDSAAYVKYIGPFIAPVGGSLHHHHHHHPHHHHLLSKHVK